MSTDRPAKNDGGPAFPANHFDLAAGEHGMTLRDYFAAHAPKPPEAWHGGDRAVTDIVAWRWYYADAMLLTRREA